MAAFLTLKRSKCTTQVRLTMMEIRAQALAAWAEALTPPRSSKCSLEVVEWVAWAAWEEWVEVEEDLVDLEEAEVNKAILLDLVDCLLLLIVT